MQNATCKMQKSAFALDFVFCILHFAFRPRGRTVLSEHHSQEILARALEAANADESDAALISIDQNISRFANSNLQQNMSEISAGLTLRVIVNGSMGVASTSSFD